jgi:hypothetical protein
MGFKVVRHTNVTITARGNRQCLFVGNNPEPIPEEIPRQMAFEFELGVSI